MRRPPKLLRIMPILAAALFLCVAAKAQRPEASAKVTVQSGQVSSLTSNGLRALFEGDLVKPQQIIVTGPDGYAQFQLADGSSFEVFPNSRVTFREHVGSLSDLLNVWIGRVKVYIQHLNGVPNYNKVSSPTAVISVRGTVFEVVVEDEDGTTFVSVEEGLVDVRNHTAAGDAVSLHPGNSVRVYKNQPLVAKTLDRGGIGRAIVRAAEQALYEILLRSRTGGMTSPTGTATSAPPTGTANGDTGKGGTETGAPPPPGAPGAPPQ